MDTQVYLTAYGLNSLDQGIIVLTIDNHGVYSKKCIAVNGKSNMVIKTKDGLICSVQEPEGNYLLFYTIDGTLQEKIKTEHFYSFGTLSNGYLLLASFDDGLDSSYHLTTHQWTSNVHQRSGITTKGRSQFIKRIGNKIITVDNAYQQIYVYEDETLKHFEVIDFEMGLNLRLLSFDEGRNRMFLNTELTNELLVLSIDKWQEIDRIKINKSKSCFSGGNAIDTEHHLVCVSMRCENMIYVFDYDKNMLLVEKMPTKRMPRDLIVIGESLYVTCTDDNCVEVFSLRSFKKINEIEVMQPVTFSM